MSTHPPVAYEFGGFRLVPVDKQLLFAGQPVALAPKVFDTLCLLVENHGRLVEKSEFLSKVWQGSFVEEVALAHAVSQLRKALRDGMGESEFIETLPKRGYRFLSPVVIVRPDASETPSRVTIAVLPFENLGGGADREYLADGLTEEVISALGQVDPERLSVIGRTSMMMYKGRTKPLAEIAREFGANFVVESSVRSEGTRFRVTSRLIRASDQIQIWSESFDSQPGSIIELQRELSLALAQQIRLRVSPERLDGFSHRQTKHVEAYDLYLRGRYFWNQLSPLTTRRAVELYSRATELDPDYALAWSGLADAYTSSPVNGDAPPRQVWPKAREAAARAIKAAPGLAEAQTSLGLLKFWLDWDWAAAEAAYRQGIELDPACHLAHRLLGVVLSHSGRHEEALAAVRRAREIDPLDFTHHALSGQIAFNARDYPAAVDFARRANVLDPHFWVGYIQLAQAHLQLGNNDLALDALQKAGSFSSGNSKSISLRGYLFAKLGRIGEAREVLNTLEAVSRERYVPPYATALVYAGLGDYESAIEWLERAWDAHDVHLAFLPVDAKWDPLRNDSRFAVILDRCSFSTEKFYARAGDSPSAG